MRNSSSLWTAAIVLAASPLAGCDNGPAPRACGNGVIESGEQCDDGANGDDCDGCLDDCTSHVNTCGDGFVCGAESCDDGNAASGDGCEDDCTPTQATSEIICQTLSPLPSGTCEVTPGDVGRVIVGTVLTPSAIYRGGQVVLDDLGTIVQVGCQADCDADPVCQALAATATTFTCPQGVVTPGLINTHDHITYTNDPPYTQTAERYEHRHEWRKGLDGHTKIPAPGGASNDQIAWGELRFLMGGATSTVGSGGLAGLLRNLDKETMEEGLDQTPVFFDTFPLNDSTPPSAFPGAVDCSAFVGAVTEADIASDDAYEPHVAEGLNAYAQNEFVCLSGANAGHDVVGMKSAFIHAVGLTTLQYADMASTGTALIWSPRSNVTLYGNTAQVTLAARMGVLIALGTDWLPSGSMNMLRELRCADSLNSTYFDRFFSDRDLWMMVTSNAAVATAVDDVLGTIAPGKIGDITVFDGSQRADYRAVIDAEPADVALVMRAGKVLYGDDAVVAATPDAGSCDVLDVCSSSKRVCLQDEIGKSLSALETATAGIYPAFFCEAPNNEPSCTPSRPSAVDGSTVYTGAVTAGDQDGDGIPDASDNCPTVFNPVRPMDGGVQPDTDADGLGDPCDPCPLAANVTSCVAFDPYDRDHDGVVGAADNCPTVANDDQLDTDSDGKGDACDACPTSYNPGRLACQATIYDIKSGVVPVGAAVSLTNQLVTGRIASGYFLQAKPGDPGYAGSDYSGIYVYDPANTVAVGDRVTIGSATVTDYYTQIELTQPATTVLSAADEAAPAPVPVTAADVATGGPRAAALEGVIVQVVDATVTDLAPALGAGDSAPTYEFVVEGSLRVNDYLYRIAPFPVLGQNYASLTGIIDFRNENSKLELRGPGDVVMGAPVLVGFAPAQSFTDVDMLGTASFPEPLTVRLSNAPATDTFVAVESSDPTSLTVVGGGVTVLAGETSALVLVDGLAQSPNVTLTATLGATSLTADVRVIGATETPAIGSLTPPTPATTPGGTVALTVALDIPAPVGGTVVALALAPADAGTLPASVTVPANELSATFDYVDAGIVTSAAVTATLGSSTASSTITVLAVAGGLVINEVDYDQIGTDNAEYAEIFNAGSTAVSLMGYSLVLVNGNGNSTYRTVDLGPAGTLEVGQYLVIGAHGVVASLPAGVLQVDLGTGTDYIQNGSPDGAALVDTTTQTLVDALSYEGAMTGVTIEGLGIPVSLVEGTVLPTSVADSTTVQGSLCRLPNGLDTSDAATDWKFCSVPTPGAANQL